MGHEAFIPFLAWNGREYELRVRFDDAVLASNLPTLLEEDERGRIFPHDRIAGRSLYPWDSLIEMTHELRVEIVSWGSDTGN